MQQPPKNHTPVITDEHRALVAEFLIACATDVSYGVAMSRTAMDLKKRRAVQAARKATKEATTHGD